MIQDGGHMTLPVNVDQVVHHVIDTNAEKRRFQNLKEFEFLTLLKKTDISPKDYFVIAFSIEANFM